VLPHTDFSSLVRHIHSVAFWADFDDLAYAVAIWTTPSAANRMNEGAELLELRRFAIAPDAPKNTASRMLSVMRRLIARKWPSLIRLVSYQAEDQHAGTIYKAAGWTAAYRSEAVPWGHNRYTPAVTHLESAKVRWEMPLRAPPKPAQQPLLLTPGAPE